MKKIPKGTTHTHDCYGHTSFWAWKALRFSSELGGYIFCWFSWNGKGWQRESHVNDMNFMPITKENIMTKQELLDAIKAKRAEIDAKQAEIDTFEPDEDEAENAYVEMLDECYGKIKIGYLSWPASQVLKEMDECDFRCGLNDFISNEVTECPERFEGYTELQEELSELQDELSDLESELEELEETEE